MYFNGIGSGIHNLFRVSNAQSRSISPENYTGEKGGGGACELEDGFAKHAAADLGKGWKVNPYVIVKPQETFTVAQITGPGCIQHIWLTPTGNWRSQIIRFYWDDQPFPSVECPLGDFFACGWNQYAQVSSLAVCVNPGKAFNCYWQMPFRKSCRITLENIGDEAVTLYYQVDYIITEVYEDAAYFHASFRRTNPLPYKQDFTIIDGIEGKGQYVGTYLCWGVHNNGWWGEGEIKFFIDGDGEYPTICGTGTEDYFCGSYNFDIGGKYQAFTTPYSGMPQVIRGDGLYQVCQRFGLYRWHITDPIRFEQNLRVTIQALGGREGGKYLPLQDDISAVSYWYQLLPGRPLTPLPEREFLEII